MKNLWLAVALLLVIFIVPSVNALMIDDFTVYQYLQVYSPNSNSDEAPASPPGDLSILGGFRDLYVESTSGPDNTSYTTAKIISSMGLLSFSNDALVTGHSVITWDGNDDNALPSEIDYDGLYTSGTGVDLTESGANTGILFATNSIDLNVSITFILFSDSINYSSFTYTSTQPNDFFIPFSAFNVDGGSGADETNIGAIQMWIAGPENTDATFDFIESTTEVPEPATYLLFGIGILGFAGGIRKKIKR